MPTRRAVASGFAAWVLAGCAEPVRDAPEAVARARAMRSPGPPSITLYTMIRNDGNKGSHNGVAIDGPTRVVFDPAGSFRHPQAPRVDDVHYGFTTAMEAWYLDYHARETFRVVRQYRPVSMQTAAAALARAEATGPVIGGFCTIRATQVFAGLPGFEDYRATWFPDEARDRFGRYPDVVEQVFRDDSPDDRSDIGGLGGYTYIGQGTALQG